MKEIKSPLVSVIIPTYKRSDTLPRAIDSVLNQTYSNIEIIVVDDNGEGSEFQLATEERLKDYIDQGKIKYIKHKTNKNGSAARNTGFRQCKGKFVNFLDDDDIFIPEKINMQVLCLLNETEYGACYCNTEIVYPQKYSFSFKKRKTVLVHSRLQGNLIKEFLTGQCKFNTSAILFRREMLEELNGFDETWRRHQDFELMVRFFRKYLITNASDKPLMIYDLSSETNNQPNCHDQFLLEERFLKVFYCDLNSNEIYNEIAYHLWMTCLHNALRTGNIEYIKKTYKKLVEIGKIQIGDLKDLIKSICHFFIKII